MSKSKHTPRPWCWLPGEKPTHKELVQTNLIGEGTDSILFHGADWPMNEADLRLIAAAPNLLDACNKSLTAFRAMYNDMEKGVSAEEIYKNELYWPLKQLRIAIEQAEKS